MATLPTLSTATAADAPATTKPNRFRARCSSSNTITANGRSTKPWWHSRLATSSSAHDKSTPPLGVRIDPEFVSSPFADKQPTSNNNNPSDAWKSETTNNNNTNMFARTRNDSYDSDASTTSNYRNHVESFKSLTGSPITSPLTSTRYSSTSASPSRPNPFRSGANATAAAALVRRHSLSSNPYESRANTLSPTASSNSPSGGSNSPSGPTEVLLRGLRMDGPGGTSTPKHMRSWRFSSEDLGESNLSKNRNVSTSNVDAGTAAIAKGNDGEKREEEESKFLNSSRASKRFKSVVTMESTHEMSNNNNSNCNRNNNSNNNNNNNNNNPDKKCLNQDFRSISAPHTSSFQSNTSLTSNRVSLSPPPPPQITPTLLASLEMPVMRTNPRRFGQIDEEDSLIHPFGVSACRGPRRHMEDRFCIQGRVGGSGTKSNVSMYGVFDGHGGASAADFASNTLVNNLASSESFPAHQSLTEAFIKTDKQFCSTPRQLAGRDPLAGTTAVVALVQDDQLITANAGDSRAVLVRADGTAVQLTKDHRTHAPSEHARVLAAGGTVNDGRVNSVLSMTRAIGDKRLKQYVVATPEVNTHTVDSEDHYLVIATDGIWDSISNGTVAAIVKCADEADYAADCLIAAASTCSTDNSTVLVVDLRKKNTVPDVPPRMGNQVGSSKPFELNLRCFSEKKEKTGGGISNGRVSAAGVGVVPPAHPGNATVTPVVAVPLGGLAKFRNRAAVLRRSLTIEVNDDEDDD